jgi:hypothetical protein
MAPPRKKKRPPGEGHPIYLRLPDDVFRLIEERANEERWPLNRAVINLLASIPTLEKRPALEDILEEMSNTLARYSSRVTFADLNEPLLAALDELLAAPSDAELKRRLDKVRVLRDAMLKHERESKG